MSDSPWPRHFFKFMPFRDQLVEDENHEVSRRNYASAVLTDRKLFCQEVHKFDDIHDGMTGPTATGCDDDFDRYANERMPLFSNAMKRNKFHSFTQVPESDDPESTNALLHRQGQDLRRSKRILCLTSRLKHECLWSTYAENHTGICLVFDANSDTFKDARRVEYRRKPPSLGEGDLLKPLFVKSFAWSYQKEWRLVQDQSETFLPFKPADLLGVVVGYRFDRSQEKALHQVLIQCGYEIPIFRISRSFHSFHLKVHSLGRI